MRHLRGEGEDQMNLRGGSDEVEAINEEIEGLNCELSTLLKFPHSMSYISLPKHGFEEGQ